MKLKKPKTLKVKVKTPKAKKMKTGAKLKIPSGPKKMKSSGAPPKVNIGKLFGGKKKKSGKLSILDRLKVGVASFARNKLDTYISKKTKLHYHPGQDMISGRVYGKKIAPGKPSKVMGELITKHNMSSTKADEIIHHLTHAHSDEHKANMEHAERHLGHALSAVMHASKTDDKARRSEFLKHAQGHIDDAVHKYGFDPLQRAQHHVSQVDHYHKSMEAAETKAEKKSHKQAADIHYTMAKLFSKHLKESEILELGPLINEKKENNPMKDDTSRYLVDIFESSSKFRGHVNGADLEVKQTVMHLIAEMAETFSEAEVRSILRCDLNENQAAIFNRWLALDKNRRHLIAYARDNINPDIFMDELDENLAGLMNAGRSVYKGASDALSIGRKHGFRAGANVAGRRMSTWFTNRASRVKDAMSKRSEHLYAQSDKLSDKAVDLDRARKHFGNEAERHMNMAKSRPNFNRNSAYQNDANRQSQQRSSLSNIVAAKKVVNSFKGASPYNKQAQAAGNALRQARAAHRQNFGSGDNLNTIKAVEKQKLSDRKFSRTISASHYNSAHAALDAADKADRGFKQASRSSVSKFNAASNYYDKATGAKRLPLFGRGKKKAPGFTTNKGPVGYGGVIYKHRGTAGAYNESVEELNEGFSRAHFQAAVNHTLTHEPEHHEEIAKAHAAFFRSQHPGFKPGRFHQAVERGTFFNEKNTLPTLTRQHMQAAADFIKNHHNPMVKKALGDHYASMFARANERFNETKFRNAAGLNEDVNEGLMKNIKRAFTGKTVGNVMQRSHERAARISKTAPARISREQNIRMKQVASDPSIKGEKRLAAIEGVRKKAKVDRWNALVAATDATKHSLSKKSWPTFGKKTMKESYQELKAVGFSDEEIAAMEAKLGVDSSSVPFQIDESFNDVIQAFASQQHEKWRKSYDPHGQGKPRMKKNSDGTEGDINVPFHKLHPDWQKENIAAAHAALTAHLHHPKNDDAAAEHIHNEWMKRNPKAEWNAAQHVPYSQLPDSEKAKDLEHVETIKSLIPLRKKR